MPSDGHEERTFDAIRQFTVVPDRRYRVEQRDGSLHFQRTGSQFDIQWLVRGARARLGDRIADAFERSSRSRLILGGIVIAVVSCLVFVFAGASVANSDLPMRGANLRGLFALFFAFVVGLIMIIAGISTRRQGESQPRHDFSLPVSDIVAATLLPVQSELARRGEPQVARLQLKARSGSTIKLGIPTESDLETAKSWIPNIAA